MATQINTRKQYTSEQILTFAKAEGFIGQDFLSLEKNERYAVQNRTTASIDRGMMVFETKEDAVKFSENNICETSRIIDWEGFTTFADGSREITLRRGDEVISFASKVGESKFRIKRHYVFNSSNID